MAETASISKFTQEISGIRGQFKQVANESNRKIASISKDLAKHFNTQQSRIGEVSSNVEDIENKTQQLNSKIDSAVAIINNDMSVDNEILSTVKAILKYVKEEEEKGKGGSRNNDRSGAEAILSTKQGAKLNAMITGAGAAATQMLNDDIGSKGGAKQGGKFGEPFDTKGDNKQGEDTAGSSSKGGDDKMTKIQTKGGKAVQVHADYAKNFEGFINELESSGYSIKSIGGYANRNIAGTGTASWHSKGMAIDINPESNPVTRGEPGRKPKTDMPENVGQMAAKYGLGWGGAWDGEKQDAMHFSIGEGPGAMLRGQREAVGLGKNSGGGTATASSGGGGNNTKVAENKAGGKGGETSGAPSATAEKSAATPPPPENEKNGGSVVERSPIVKASLSETEQSAIKAVSVENKATSPVTAADATPVKPPEIPRLADVQERIKKEGTPDTFPGNSGGTFKKNADGSATLTSSKGDKTDFTAEQYEREVAKRTWDKESKAAMISNSSSPASTAEAVSKPAVAASVEPAVTATPAATTTSNTPTSTAEKKPVRAEGGLLTAADIFPGHDPNSPGVKATVARFQAKQIERDPSLKTSTADFAQLDAVDATRVESPAPQQAATINQAAENKELQMQQQVATATPPENRQPDTTVNNNYQTAQNDSDPSISWSEKLMGHFNMGHQVKTGMTEFSMFG